MLQHDKRTQSASVKYRKTITKRSNRLMVVQVSLRTYCSRLATESQRQIKSFGNKMFLCSLASGSEHEECSHL